MTTDLKIRVKADPTRDAATLLIANARVPYDAFTTKPDDNERFKLALDLSSDDRVVQQVTETLETLAAQLADKGGVEVHVDNVWSPLNSETGYLYTNWTKKMKSPHFVNEQGFESAKALAIKEGAVVNYKVRIKAYLGEDEETGNAVINLQAYPDAIILIKQGNTAELLKDEFDF